MVAREGRGVVAATVTRFGLVDGNEVRAGVAGGALLGKEIDSKRRCR